MEENLTDPPNITESSVYVDRSRLAAQNGVHTLKTSPKGTSYSINNTTYYDEETPNNKYVEFQLYAERLSNINGNFFIANDEMESQFVYCSTPESEADEDDQLNSDRELKMIVQKVSHGIVINSNVYLTDEQWNTIIFEDSYLLRCVACEMFTDLESCAVHIKRDSHINSLQRCPPLARFELSITRKIRKQYHCGVCNLAFDLDKESEHFSSKSHEENFLFAINKVSDIDLNDENNVTENVNDCYHFNANAINNRNENNDDYYNENDYNDSVDSLSDYECNDATFDGEYESLWGVFDQKPKKTGSSYATMLKKPKILDIPMFLEKDLGNKKVKVKFDSYHMLIKPKLNRFYCMVCKDYSHIREKAAHCSDKDHLDKLDQMRVVDTFGDYYIRVMDDKFYHCGHCNNLVLISDMDDHLEERHGKKTTIAIESAKKPANTAKNTNNDAHSSVSDHDEAIENGVNDRCDTNDNRNKNNDGKVINDKIKDTAVISYKMKPNNNGINANNLLLINGPKLCTDVVFINPFGYRMVLPMLHFNVILKRQYFSDYYCGLCDIICTEEAIIQHVYCIPHIQMLQRTPFIMPFNCNLIRAIREKFHCAVCNIPISLDLIYVHLKEPMHFNLLTKALSANNTATTGMQGENETNNVQNPIPQPRTLPPNSNNVNNGQEIPKSKSLTKETTVSLQETEITAKETPVTKETGLTMKETGSTTKETSLTKKEMMKDADEMDLMLNESIESIDLDLEDYVYVKIKNAYFKISFTSYNSLVPIGDGTRYCFVCSSKIGDEDLKRHVESRSHVKNIDDNKFLDKFEGTLLRQIFLMYHCSTCNVIISRRELKNHVAWPTHAQEIASTQSVSKKSRKNDVKSGKTMYVANVTKEIIYLNEKEPKIKVTCKIKLGKNKQASVEKKKKIVIVDGDVLKINFKNWNGVSVFKNEFKCQLCQVELTEEEISDHVHEESHVGRLETGFKEGFLVHLLRQINDNILHCMICNAEVSNKNHILREHIDGKRHKNNLESIRNMSSVTDAYTDCENDVLQL